LQKDHHFQDLRTGLIRQLKTKVVRGSSFFYACLLLCACSLQLLTAQTLNATPASVPVRNNDSVRAVRKSILSFNFCQVARALYTLQFERAVYKNLSITASAGITTGTNYIARASYYAYDFITESDNFHVRNQLLTDDFEDQPGWAYSLGSRIYMNDAALKGFYSGFRYEHSTQKFIVPKGTGFNTIVSEKNNTAMLFFPKMEETQTLKVGMNIFSFVFGRQFVTRSGFTHDISFECGQTFIRYNRLRTRIVPSQVFANSYTAQAYLDDTYTRESIPYIFLNYSIGYLIR
jgi:hypothetical protein